MNIIAIDPGLSGAIASICGHTGKIVQLHDMPVIARTDKKNWVNVPLLHAIMKELFSTSYNSTVYIEQVHAMPEQGVSSMFTFGEGLGCIRATCICNGYSVEWVTPQKWKKHFNLIGKDKKMSASVAVNRYPNDQDKFVTPRGRALDGRADAILLARYIYDTEL